jgi:hypothetical protein
VLRELLALKADGIESFSSEWFWYDSHSCSDGPHELYNFFVVSGDRIVREMSRSATTMTADLIQLFSFDNSDFIWLNDSDWREATTRFWYLKF